MRLTQSSLEMHGWLFSASLGLMVREHEIGNGLWDIEIEFYRNVNTVNDPVWDMDTNTVYPAYKTVAEAVAENPHLTTANDWISGDKVNFF